MADHGSIGTYRTLSYARPMPVWAEDYRGLHNIPVTGELSGHVKVAGVAIQHAQVCLYYRPTGVLIARKTTDAAGAYSFSGLELTVDDYYIVALAPDYNARVFDAVVPV